MAISEEFVEGPEVRKGSLPKRPALAIGGALVVLGTIALYVVFDDTKAAATAEEEAILADLKPARNAPLELAAEHERDKQVAAQAEASAVQPAPSGLYVPDDENLGTTDRVEPLPGDARGRAGPGAALSGRDQLFEEHAEQLTKWQLEMQLAAFGAGTRVKSFDQARKREDRELAAELGLGGVGGGMGGSEADDIQAALSPALAMLNSRPSGGGGGGMGPAADGMDGTRPNNADPNNFAQKNRFFQNGGDQLRPGVLDSDVREARSPFVLAMGGFIPGMLVSGINSETPGQITATVTQNVMDSASQTHLLIPQGSQLVGTYSVVVAQGQTRVQVAWVRLNFPNGASLDLSGMAGADQAGIAGFHDRVNRHFGRLFASALLTSSLSIAYEITAPRNGQLIEGAVHRGLGESIVKLGTDLAQRESQIAPTLEIRPGYRFIVQVSKDVVFAGPYRDGINRRTRRKG